jgi:glycolate oxidase
MTDLVQLLKNIVAEKNLLTQPEEMAYAAIDQSSGVAKSVPKLVVKVATQEEFIHVVRLLLKYEQPMLVRAAGTGKVGACVADANTVIIDILGLNKIININKKALYAELEPGVLLKNFKHEVERHDLYYPPDPASWQTCTVGGNVAQNAAGPSSLKYGSTKDYFLGGQAILANGELIDFGRYCHKGVAGYDMPSLLCGSEGTLALFTQLRLRLIPMPKDFYSGIFYFESAEAALKSVNRIFCDGHLPKSLEYIDRQCLNAVKKMALVNNFPPHAEAALLIECDASFLGGAKQSFLALSETVHGFAQPLPFDKNEHGAEAMWALREKLSEACSHYLGKKISEDVSVPLDRLHEFGLWFKTQERWPDIACALFGHAGDGNLHVQIMYSNNNLINEVHTIRKRVILKVIELRGTISAEHGIGLQKKAFLPLEQSAELLALQKRIKNAFDHKNLFNPGKIFESPC